MAPKTKSAAGSSQSFDSSKFLNYETQKKFTDQNGYMSSKNEDWCKSYNTRSIGPSMQIDGKYSVNILNQPLFLL